MAITTNYTASPLGLIDESNLRYDETGGEYKSLFSSSTKFRTSKGYDWNGLPPVLSSDDLHSDDVYNISTNNIIDKLSKLPTVSLKQSDFAYLKDYGVFPNNRLVIMRRFPTPVMDDLYSERIYTVSNDTGTRAEGQGGYPVEPMSTILGYKKEDEDFIDFAVSEEWVDAEATFTNILNDLGNDFGMSGQFQLGSILERGLNVLPLPGASLLFQRQLLRDLGILTNSELSDIPIGDPNLIKQARTRSLTKDDKDGSGLQGRITVKLKTVYEQKFINGVDPTIVWMDIMANILTMGTSNANFYLGKANGNTRLDNFVRDMVRNPIDVLKRFITASIKSFKKGLENLKAALKGIRPIEDEEEADKRTAKEVLDIEGAIQRAAGYVEDFISAKYRVRAFGVLAALSGGPSTPWHVTVGNPLRPIFCSGDMECEEVSVKLGSSLSFNDLPSTIEVDITLKSARNLGLQEIFSKFNSGGIRIVEGTATDAQRTQTLIETAPTFWNENVLTGGGFSDAVGNSQEKLESGGQIDKGQSKIQGNNQEVIRDANSNNSIQPIGLT